MSSEQGFKVGDMVEVIHGYRHSERRGIVEDIPSANDALILVEFDNGEQQRINRNTVRKLPAGLKHPFNESDYVVINAPGNTYDGVTGRIAEVHQRDGERWYMVHHAVRGSVALGSYRADQLRPLGDWAGLMGGPYFLPDNPTKEQLDAMYREEMAEQYRRQNEKRAEAEQNSKRFLKVGGGYIAIDQIDSIRALGDGDAKIKVGDVTYLVIDPGEVKRLVTWADRNSLDLGG